MPPSFLMGLRAFLGLMGYYLWFVRHYASSTDPLTDLLKGPSFHWLLAATSTFEALKRAMLSIPVPCLLDFSMPFDVTTDASQLAVVAVLSQHHCIAFFTKKTSPKIQVSSAYERSGTDSTIGPSGRIEPTTAVRKSGDEEVVNKSSNPILRRSIR
ncbi:Retrovirus-related Pol polyprotein from transposon [Sesamum alatum]|uniref:Retrovirus-related Pol polyprotein from transposon n=1 Tax=Sesamum alatum TaxID=300844 RepID=A0AAE1Y8F6_9LAMI|nr:Retrovirus-related Pol polyprotein from transposon [Sesamum alatum]